MAKGKDEKKGKRKVQAKSGEEKQIVQLEQFDNKFNIDGVVKLVLSTITQRTVGCVVGEDITTEDPWIYIKKEKIQDNLDLHEESSEFLPIKECIIEYPAEDMLIGFDKPIEDDKQEFFFCTKLAAQNEVAIILEKQKIEMQERLKQSVQKYPRKWKSFGSETEVNENIIQNLRPLFKVEINSKYPLYSEKKKFRLRLVEDAIDGYVEMLPGRFPITNVYRKRVDCAIQASPPTTENETQTNHTYPKDIWTQYIYEYQEPQLNSEKRKHLIEFMMKKAEDLYDTINVNEHINLYTNDYLRISKEVFRAQVFENRDVISFREVISCKGLSVSDVVLDPFVSGLIAVSYSRSPFNKMYTPRFMKDEVNETTFGSHLVIIWCNTEYVRPKLYLHSYREVNKLRYCSRRPNILFGGCNNGQIVIWDLTGKLESVETREILSHMEQKHKHFMHSLMHWMKFTDKVDVVLPTAISNLDYSHNAPVVSLENILYNYQINKNGKIEKLPKGEESIQFVSCGMDGRILVWDLLTQPQEASALKKKKPKKVDKRPSSLLTNVSEFRKLNNIFMPIYKINVRNRTTQALYPLTCVVIRNSNFEYKARNPETLNNIYTRTYFDLKESNSDYAFTNSLNLCDKLGNFAHCHFEGHDFDQGQKLNYENISYSSEFITIHDGPIRVCLNHGIDPNVVLTVGGRVWAIWHAHYPGIPILWRKSEIKYISGVWSSQQVGAFVVIRADSYLETWTILQYTKGPARLIRMPGNPVWDYFSDYRYIHVKKDTVIMTDSVGAVRIYLVPKSNKIKKDVDITVFIATLVRYTERREKYKAWLQAWKQRYGQEKSQPAEAHPTEQPKPAEGEEANVEIKQEETKKEKPDAAKAGAKQEGEHHKKNTEPVISAKRWQEEQEMIMYNVMLERHKLNLPEIEQHKIPLQKHIEAQQNKQIKVQEIFSRKNKIFNNAKTKVLQLPSKKSRYEPVFAPENYDMVQETFVEHYNVMLSDTMKYIKTHSYKSSFNWNTMICRAKQQRKSLVYFAHARGQKESTKH